LFFVHWFCENGLLLEIVSDRDKLFVSHFWRGLHKLTGVKLKMSSAYHLETDGSSERSNKTIVQALRYHVERNQKGWARALPAIRFHIMNTVNSSTGYTPFHLRMGRSPRLIPPLCGAVLGGMDEKKALDALSALESNLLSAKDNLIKAKLAQASQANKDRGQDLVLNVGDRVLLNTEHRRREYMQKKDGRVAKLMPRFDGPYTVTAINKNASTVTLDMPNSPNIYHTFHTSQVKPFTDNDSDLFPSREQQRPGLVISEDGQEDWAVDKIIDQRCVGRGYQYLVQYRGYSPDPARWKSGSELKGSDALTRWLEIQGK
jgi:hypothetical protein